MILTPLTLAHAPLIASMHHVCFAQPWDEAAMRSLLEMPGAFGWLVADPSPAGFLLARHAVDEAEILTLMVLPPFRRRGIGRHLLQAVRDEAKGRGAAKLFLEVARNNISALFLYTECGFAQIGVRPRYYEDGKDALLLSVAL